MWLEAIYMTNLSAYLRNFKQLADGNFNFSCPICGDSSKNHKKARGYMLLDGGKYHYYCHNCHATRNFHQFLQEVNPSLYDEFIREMYKEKKDKSWIQRPKQDIKKNNNESIAPLLKLKKISSLSPDHPAKKYIVSRMIPNRFHAWLFFAPKFKEFTNSIIPEYFQEFKFDEQRIIIPLLDQQNRLLGFQGRALGNSKNRERYITVLLDKDNPKIFGLNFVDFNYTNYCLEGPFDSMFIPNAFATCGGKITSELEKSSCITDRTVIVYDNQPRNPDVVRSVEAAIDAGYKVCIWPEGTSEKDINDMILSLEPSSQEDVKSAGTYIQTTIDNNTHSGLGAKLRFTKWKKI